MNASQPATEGSLPDWIRRNRDASSVAIKPATEGHGEGDWMNDSMREALRIHAESPEHHYSADDCRAALAAHQSESDLGAQVVALREAQTVYVNGMRISAADIRDAAKSVWRNGIMERDEAYVRAAAEQMASLLEATDDPAAAESAKRDIERPWREALEWCCPDCEGAGYTIGADPLPSGEAGEPYQVRCFHERLPKGARVLLATKGQQTSEAQP